MRIVIDKDVQVRMRDGVHLAADVYHPDGQGPFPTLLTRSPYNKELPRTLGGSLDVLRTVKAGYAVVAQDTRGRWASGGTFNTFGNEAEDGAETVQWVSAQPWSDGKVGMFGGSYVGHTQWTAASRAPAALKGIAPYVTGDQYYDGWAYQGGAFELGFNLNWALSLALGELMRRMTAGTAAPDAFAKLIAAIDGNDELYHHLPLGPLPELQDLAPYYDDWLAHPSYDEFWKATAPRESYGAITVPALNMGGWFDLFLKGTIANYVGMKAHGGSEFARQHQRLVIGPWSHGPSAGTFAERSYGIMSGTDTADLPGLHLRWYDWLLRGLDHGIAGEKPVRIFVMGADVWRDEDDWPLPDTDYVDYFLHSRGRANTASGDGLLSLESPAEEPDDVYLYDPRNPVPTVGGGTFLPGLGIGANAGPRDQRSVEARSDVLCYATEPLEVPLEATGPVVAVLSVSSSALDTDFTAKLVDVFPNGRCENVCDGILRARYRDSLTEPSLLAPGRTYEITVDLVATAYVFGAGHRIRFDVSSSNFPRFDRNTNSGGVIATEGADDLVQAVNRVHHSAAHPSRLVLPVIHR